jgi:hypothetical protein
MSILVPASDSLQNANRSIFPMVLCKYQTALSPLQFSAFLSWWIAIFMIALWTVWTLNFSHHMMFVLFWKIKVICRPVTIALMLMSIGYLIMFNLQLLFKILLCMFHIKITEFDIDTNTIRMVNEAQMTDMETTYTCSLKKLRSNLNLLRRNNNSTQRW